MPSTRLPASRQTAKASGSSSSSVAPRAMRSLNSSVFACRARSLSRSSSGSSALILATFFWNWRRRRSLRLPKMRVSKLLSMWESDRGTAEPVSLTWGGPGRYQPPCRRNENAPRGGVLETSLGRLDSGAGLGEAALFQDDLVEEGTRIARAAVHVHFEMHVRAGGTSRGTGLRELLP